MSVKLKGKFKRLRKILFMFVTFIGPNMAIAAKATAKCVE
jgi:hypothetical protein